MTTEIINSRYQIIKKISEGDLCLVYLAQDLLNNHKQIAIKTFRENRIDRDRIKRFKHEFSILSRFRHPNLEQVLDFGTIQHPDIDTNTEYYFTAEFIDGPDLNKLVQTPVSAKDIHSIIVQLCRALQFIHSMGLIHYDVKPSNVLVRRMPDRTLQVKLIDFGLAEDKSFDLGSHIRGTLPYVSPEIILGNPKDHRLDLYSLGITLYEIISGDLPFKDANSLSLIHQQIENSPDPLNSRISGLSASVSRIVYRLLEKEPDHRYQCANDIIGDLNKLNGSTFKLETPETRESYFVSSRMIGRENKLDKIIRLMKNLSFPATGRSGPIKECPKRFPSAMVILGDPGVGKTRLIEELKLYATLNDIHFLSGSGVKTGSNASNPFSSILQGVVTLLVSDRISRQKDVSRILKKYNQHLAEIFPDIFHGTTRKTEEDSNLKNRRTNCINSICEFLLEAAVICPMILCFEDLHWYDKESLDIFMQLVRSMNIRNQMLKNGRETCLPSCLLLATSRIQNNGAAPITDLINPVCKELHIQKMRLHPFNIDSVSEYLKSILGPVEGIKFLAQKLKRATGGNPFFIQEVMKDLAEQGLVKIEHGEWFIDEIGLKPYKIPAKISKILKQNVKELGNQERDLVNVLAVMKRSVNLEELAGITQYDINDLAVFLEVLVRKNMISSVPFDGRICFRLVHESLQEVIYQELSESERKLLHFRVAAFMESQLNQQSKKPAIETLAIHYSKSGDTDKALQYCFEGADLLMKKCAYDQSFHFLNKILRLLGDEHKNKQWELKVRLGQTYSALGQAGEAARIWEDLYQTIAEKPEDQSLIVLGNLANTSIRKGQFEIAESILKQARDIANKKPDPKDLMKVDFYELKLMEAKGDISGANAHFQKIIKKIRYPEFENKETAAFLMAGVQLLIGQYMGHPENLDKALEIIHRTLHIHHKTGNRRGEIYCYNSQGLIFGYKMDKEKEIESHQKALDIAREVGDRLNEGICYGNLGSNHGNQGNYSRAIECWGKLHIIAEESGDHVTKALSLWNMGIFHAYKSELKIALKYLDHARKLYEEAGYKERVARVLFSMGMAYEIVDEFEKANEHFFLCKNVFNDLGLNSHEQYTALGIARMYLNLYQFDQCSKLTEELLRRASSEGNLRIELGTLNIKADRFIMIEEDTNAIKNLEKIIQIAGKHDSHSAQWSSILKLAEIFHLQGAYDQVEHMVEMAAELERFIEFRSQLLKYKVLFKIYCDWGALKQSERIWNEEKTYIKKAYPDSMRKKVIYLRHQAELLVLKNKPDYALKLLRKVLLFADKLNDERMKCTVSLDLAELLFRCDRLQEASTILIKHRPMIEGFGLRSALVRQKYLELLLTREKASRNTGQIKYLTDKLLELIKSVNRPEIEWKVYYEIAKTYLLLNQSGMADNYFEKTGMILQNLLKRVPESFTGNYRNSKLRQNTMDHIEKRRQQIKDNQTEHRHQSRFEDSDTKYVNTLLEMLRIVGASRLDLESIFSGFLEKMIEVTGAERGILFLTDHSGALDVKTALDNEGHPIKTVDRISRSIPDLSLRKKQSICVTQEAKGEDWNRATASMAAYDLRSVMCVPLETEFSVIGVIYVDSRAVIREYQMHDLAFLEALCRHMALHIENNRLWHEKSREEETKRELLELEFSKLQQSLSAQKILIGKSPGMNALMDQVQQVAKTEATVLLEGETGTGKESIAHTIHELSPRNKMPFVVIDCATIPENLLESELFGHEKGSFSGAVSKKIGKFELAHKGTVFLDEISELPLSLQAKLLRVLEQKSIERIGGSQKIATDIRILAASNRDLKKMTQESTFRSDLFYRLHVVQLILPPLRDRGRDIIYLARHFMNQYSIEYNKKVTGFTSAALSSIDGYKWPGNIRELKHRIQRAVILTTNSEITTSDLELKHSGKKTQASGTANTVWEKIEHELDNVIQNILINNSQEPIWSSVVLNLECRLIECALEMSNNNKTHASWLIGMERRKIVRHLEKLKKTAAATMIPEKLKKLQDLLISILADRSQYARNNYIFDNLIISFQNSVVSRTYIKADKNKARTKNLLGIPYSLLLKRLKSLQADSLQMDDE